MFKKVLTVALAGLCAASAMAATEFYVVVPLKGRLSTVPAEGISVTLQAATLPAAVVGQAYSHNLRDHLLVTGDPALNLSQATFTTPDALPPGLSLASSGLLSGQPTVKNEAGQSFQVTASYKTKTGQQVYTIVVNGAALQVTAIVAGQNHACALTTSGGVKCWGDGTKGELGNGATGRSLTPVDVQGLTSGVTHISSNFYHTCAVTTSGGVKCWGYNNYGQLGDGTTTNSSIPVNVTGLQSGISAVSTANYHTCALTTAGGVKCWGYNGQGQAGDNTKINRPSPVDVAGLSGVSMLSSGGFFNCALANGGVKCWGANTVGQLGNNTVKTESLTPGDVIGLTSGVVYLKANNAHVCAITTSGGAKCWGEGSSGELGYGGNQSKLTPVDVVSLTNAVNISPGGRHTCAVTASGAAKCWGVNSSGALGDNTGTLNRYTPVDVVGLSSGVGSVTASNDFSCAKMTSGSVKCWGKNVSGQLGNNSTVSSPVPVDLTP